MNAFQTIIHDDTKGAFKVNIKQWYTIFNTSIHSRHMQKIILYLQTGQFVNFPEIKNIFIRGLIKF